MGFDTSYILNKTLPIEITGNVVENDRLKVDIGGAIKSVTFHNAATTAVVGTPFDVGAFKTLTIEIFGASTSRTINFYGRGPSNINRPLPAVKMSDVNFPIAVSTTGTGELWQLDITGLTQIVIELVAVTGGDVTVKGTAIA